MKTFPKFPIPQKKLCEASSTISKSDILDFQNVMSVFVIASGLYPDFLIRRIMRDVTRCCKYVRDFFCTNSHIALCLSVSLYRKTNALSEKLSGNL